MIQVLAVGLQATIQDLGRHGFGHLGVPTAGAVDAQSLRQGNRLVGNPDAAAGIEILLGGFSARFTTDAVIALTGAPSPARLDRMPVAAGTWTYVRAGQHLTLDSPTVGLRTYLTIAGGIDVTPVLGSRSTDTLAGLGPEPLVEGSQLSIGEPTAPPAIIPDLVVSHTARPYRNRLTLPIRLGPRDDMFGLPGIRQLLDGPWHISTQTDRIAARLIGPRLIAEGAGQLPTEGLAPGSIQVPPAGQPIVHLANHPPTGGYPVIGVVEPDALHHVGQAPPGTRIEFTTVTGTK